MSFQKNGKIIQCKKENMTSAAEDHQQPPGQEVEPGPAPPSSSTTILNWNGVISAGSLHSAVLNITDGSVLTFGQGKHSQLGTGKSGFLYVEYLPQRVEIPDGGAVCVAAGETQTVAVTRGGMVYDLNTLSLVPGLHDVKSVVCGVDFIVCVLIDGSAVICRRANEIGPFEAKHTPLNMRGMPIVSAAAKWYRAILLFADGRVGQVQVWDLTNVVTIFDTLHHIVEVGWCGYRAAGVTENGRVLSFGSGTQFIPGVDDAVSVSCGFYHTAVVHRDGRVSTFGKGSASPLRGWLGHAGKDCEYIDGVANAVSVSCGTYHTMILHADGKVSTVGYNGTGQLGCGEGVKTVLTPRVVASVL
jgi:alpha-tubulin suppressor-like RCC1 family protein